MTEDAVSSPVGTILMVALTILLAALMLFIMFPSLFDAAVPSPIQITAVRHYDEETGRLNFDSRVILVYKGEKRLNNTCLRAVFYRNEQQVPAVISTLNGNQSIHSNHIGVQKIGGEGCHDGGWCPNQMMWIDLTDQTFFPGDMVRLDVIWMPGDQVISRSRYRASQLGT